MTSSPRTRPTPGSVVAVSVVVLLIALVAAAVALGFDIAGEAQGFITGLYPPIAVTEEGAQIRDLYTIVFVIAAVIFVLVEGLIIWSVVRYRRRHLLPLRRQHRLSRRSNAPEHVALP